MTRQLATTLLLSLTLILGSCRTSSPRTTDSPSTRDLAALEGRWEGTYYQHNIDRAYPMELVVQRMDGQDLAVTMRWPTTPQSETTGRAQLEGSRLAWSEDVLVQGGEPVFADAATSAAPRTTCGPSGGRVVLGGRYTAAFVAPHTLCGVYTHDSGGRGFFTLERAPLAAGERWKMAALQTR